MTLDIGARSHRRATNTSAAIAAIALALCFAGSWMGTVAEAGVLPVLPMLSVDKTHSGTFTQGDTADAYQIVVSNADGGPTLSPVSVTDTLPSDLTATDIFGVGWTCSLPTLTCTRDDVLQPGTSFPPIEVLVDVSHDAQPTVTNIATLSGGYANYADPPPVEVASDITPITPLPSQTITFVSVAPADATVAGDVYVAIATATSGLPVDLTIDAASATVCMIEDGTVSFIGAGPCTIDANQDGDAAYARAPQVQQSFDVAAADGDTPQTIAFTSTAPLDATVAGSTYAAAATATSHLPVVLTVDGSSATVCAISAGTVAFIGAGTCTIDANQGGDATYAAASQVQQSFPVAGAGGVAPQTITFETAAPLDAVVAGPAYWVRASATSTLPVVLTIEAASATVCTINEDTVTFIGAGTCTIDANQGGNETFAAAPQVQQAFAVAGAAGITSQAISFTSVPPFHATVAGPTYLATARATSGLPVVLTIDDVSAAVCAINAGMVTFVGIGACVIDANQGGNETFAPAPREQQSFEVAGAGDLIPQTITFTSTAPLDAGVGGAPYRVTAVATSGLPVALTIDAVSIDVCAIDVDIVTFIGEGDCTIDADQGGNDTYAPAPQAQQSFAVHITDRIFQDGFDAAP
jgi:hypothetical protein